MGNLKTHVKKFLIVLFLLLSGVISSKLNVPRVLLPIFSDFSTKFTLEATDGGCYKWTTTRADIIQLTTINENTESECSTKVIVSTVTKEEARNLAVVLAEDVHTNQTLRCDVIVDIINALSIVTTTRELFMEEAPEAFEVRAYDDQGNEFSTLEDVELEWKIVSSSPTKQATVLRYMTFNDSPYEAPPAIACLEEQNKKGYMVLLEGVKTGSSKVSVRLPYPEYKHVQPIEVQLTVVANLILCPGEVYLMAGDVVTFKLFYMNNGRMDEIKLPDAQYYLESEDKAMAQTDKKTPDVTALKEGKTRILLHDKNVDKNDLALKLPSATIHIVQPSYMTITVMPHKNWAILIGDQHDIVVEIFSKSDHKLHIGSGVEIHTSVAEPFHVEERSKNGSWIFGWGVKEGPAPVTATLVSIVHAHLGRFKLDSPVIAKSDLLIYPRIQITPSEVILPWDPQNKPKYEVDLVATGGDGRFLWTSTDHSKAAVTQSGHVKTHSHGFFEISAAMLRNHHNRQAAKFLILPPTRLEIVEFVMEGEVGSTIYLHVALYAEKPGAEGSDTESFIPFTQCQRLPFQIKQSDNKFKHNRTDVIPPVGISCGNIAMVALAVGTSKITVSYSFDGRTLEDSVTLTAYMPLKLLEPKQDVVLAVGSSINLVFTGGPRPSIGRPSDHSRIVVSSNDTIAQAFDVTEKHILPNDDLTVVNVLCRQLGVTHIKLTISNIPSVPNCKSKSSSVIGCVVCGKPRRIAIQPEIKVADAESCPMDLSADRVIVQSNYDIELDISLQDEVGRRFLNFSSLQLVWLLEPEGLAKFTTKEQMIPRPIEIGTVEVAHKTYQVIKALQDQGLIEANVTVRGYNTAVLKKNKITSEKPAFISEDENVKEFEKITAKIGLYLVEDIIVSPKSINIYNHPGNKQKISIKQGSGYYELNLNVEDIISVTYLEVAKEIEITPLKSGEVTLQVLDLCLMSKPAFVLVNVVSVGILRVEMSDKVEINRCISCIVRLYDENDNLMSLPDLDLVELEGKSDLNIVTIQRVIQEEPFPTGEIHYVITGLELGDTKITFQIYNGEEDIKSTPADLQVFPPLKLYPRNGTILIGATLQLTTKGGPKPESTVEYAISTDKTAEVNTRGIVLGKTVGKSTITAKSIGIHPTTGHRVVYSEDTAEVQVIQLSGIKIAAPLTRFKAGATVPFWAFGIPDQISPLILGTIDDQYINFDWYVEDGEIAEIRGVFHPVGVFYKTPDQVTVRISGLSPGRTKVVLKTTLTGMTVGLPKKPNVTFTTSTDIEVFEPLILTNPPKLNGQSILMSPYSSLQLETNLDSYSRITYSVPGDDMSKDSSSDRSLTVVNDVVTVSRTGFLQTGENLGHAMLIISARDDYGLKQTLSFVIEVKQIHYMMLNLRSRWQIHEENNLYTVPVGIEFELKALYYDNMGDVFQAGPSELKVRISRCDLLKVKQGASNSTLIVSSKKPGHTVVKAWADGVQKTADYVKVHAENAILPYVEHLVTGDIICLHTPVLTKFNQPGHWTTSDKGLIAIYPDRNVGLVVGNREGVVILTHSLHPAAPLHIQILPVNTMHLVPEEPFFVTNAQLPRDFHVPVVLLSEKSEESKAGNLIAGWKCNEEVLTLLEPRAFKCLISFANASASVDANEVFEIESSFIPQKGQYSCKFNPTSLRSAEISTLESDIWLWAVSEDAEVFTKVENITFVPSVFVPIEILLDESSNSAELEVIGLNYVLKKVKAKPNDENLLYVSQGYMENSNLLKFKVQLMDYHWKLSEVEDALKVILDSPLTNQTIAIVVRVPAESSFKCAVGHSPLYRFLVAYRHFLIILIVLLLILFFTFYVYAQYMQPTCNIPSNRSLLSGPRACLAASTPKQLMGAVPPYSGSSLIGTCSPSVSSGSSPSHMCAAKMNCSCCPGRREPVYGDVSSFYSTSPELRRNRRFI